MEERNYSIIMYTTEDVQKILKIGRDRAYNLMRAKGFPSMKMGRKYYVSSDALGDWLKAYRGKEFII